MSWQSAFYCELPKKRGGFILCSIREVGCCGSGNPRIVNSCCNQLEDPAVRRITTFGQTIRLRLRRAPMGVSHGQHELL